MEEANRPVLGNEPRLMGALLCGNLGDDKPADHDILALIEFLKVLLPDAHYIREDQRRAFWLLEGLVLQGGRNNR
jgi:hypothetical protein